jgi:hypothetical protein
LDVKLLITNRWFEKKVYETNHSNVGKLLLAKINMQITAIRPTTGMKS